VFGVTMARTTGGHVFGVTMARTTGGHIGPRADTSDHGRTHRSTGGHIGPPLHTGDGRGHVVDDGPRADTCLG